MPIYNYNGVDFSEEEVLSKAQEKGLDIDTYINKFGIKRIEDETTIEPPGKPRPAVKKGAVTAGKPKSTASKSVKPSSVSQDNIFGEDKIKSSFLGNLQAVTEVKEPKAKKKPERIEYKLDARGYQVPKSYEEPTMFDDLVDYVKDLFPSKEKAEEGKLTYYDQTPIRDQQISFAQDSKNAMNASGKFEFLKDYPLEERALFVSKMVAKPSYIEKKYDKSTNSFYNAPKQEAIEMVTQDIDPKKFKTKSDLNKAIELNVKNIVSKDPSFKFEQDYALAKARPLINSKIAEIKKKYSLNTQESVDKANIELKNYFEKTVTNFLINSSGFKELNKNFSNIQEEATSILDKEYSRSKDVILGTIDIQKELGGELEKVGGVPGMIGTIAKKGAIIEEGAVKGTQNIILGVKESLASSNQNSIATLNNIYSTIKDKPDNAPIDKSFSAEWKLKELNVYDPKEQDVPKTYGEAKNRVKKYLDKTSSLIRDRVKSIEKTKEYTGLFNEADLKNGIQLDDVLQLVAEQTPNLAITATGTVTGNPLLIGLGTANMFTQTYGSQYYDTIVKGLSEDLGKAPSEKEIAEAIGNGKYANRAEAAAFSAISVGLEYASQLNVLKNTGKALGLGNDANKVLGSLFRGEIKNFGKSILGSGKNIASSALGEYLTEGLQKGIDQVSMGLQLDQDARKYVNFNEMAIDAKAGGIVGAVFPFAGTVATQTGIELRASAIKAASMLDMARPSFLGDTTVSNRLQIDNFFKAAKNNIEERFKVGDITLEDKEKEIETLSTIRSSGLKIPSKFSAESKEKAVNLMLEKTNIEKEVQSKDKDLIVPELKRLEEIKSELRDISLREAISTDVELTKKMAEAIGITETTDIPDLKDSKAVYDYIKENADLEKLGLTERDIEDYSDSAGIFIPLKNGKEALIVNQEVAEMTGVVTTGQHEFLHKVIFNAVKNNTELQKKIGTELYNHIEKTLGTEVLGKTEFQKRYIGYKKDFEKAESKASTAIKNAKNNLDNGAITEDEYNKVISVSEKYLAKEEGKYLEEVLPLLSESLNNGDIKYNETFFTKIGDIVRRLLQRYGFKNISFETGEDVFNFVKDYNKTFKKGTGNKAFERLTKEGIYKKPASEITEETTKQDIKSSKAQVESLTKELQDLEDEYDEGYGDMEEAEYTAKKANIERKIKTAEKLIEKAPVKEEVVKKEKTKEEQEDDEENALKKIIREEKASISSDKVQKIYNEKGRNGADEIIKLFRPITNRIVDKRRDAPDFDRELLTDEIETGVGGILDLITKYKPESGVPLAAYINKYLPVRAIATSRRILGKEFSKDVTEEVGIMATETADQNMTARTVEKPKYKNALESKVFEPETLETINNKIITVIRTLKSRIDAPITLNRTVTPLIAEIRDEIGKQADIDVKTVMGGKKDDQLKNWLLKNKKYILENMTTTWLMGKDGQGGMPIAIQKRIDGKWTNFPEWVGKKIDRESVSTDNAGRTAGHELVRRLPNVANNISDADFLDQIIGPDGNPIRGRKESLAKVIAEEAAFDIVLDDLANEGPIFDALKTNQERKGVEVLETLSAEIARQAERGNVKQSKKVAREVLTVLSKNEWDLNNEDYKKFVSGLSKEDSEYVTNVLQEKSIKQLRKYLKVIDLENKEFDFKNKIISALEDPVEKVLSKINRFKLVSKVASTSTSKLTDLKIEYKKNTYNFELKLDKDSRLKGVVINNVTTNPTINKDTGINDVIAETLKNDPNIKAYTDYLLENGGEIVANGNIKVPIEVFKDPKARALQEKAKVRISANADLVKKLNGGTNDAITFGGVGTFSYGDTKFEGILPDLEGDVNFEITTQRGSMDKDKNVNVYFIGFPKMASNWDQKSPVDIHDKPKKLLTIIRKASLLKRNRISARAVKAVLNAARPSYVAKPKKISVIDIDERLAKIKKKVSYKDKEGKVKKLTIPEFLKQQMQLELDGIIFDYTDVKAEVAKNKDILDGFDNTDPESSFGVTIEPTESGNAIQVLLQNVGVNIPANNINTLDDNTDQAKADWVTSKFSEGFNDFNIAGDKFKNSKGVKTILEDFDVKGEKQQKKLAFFNSLDGQFNKIISQNTGIGPMITYSDIVAKRRGASKGIFDVYVPPSAADFELLLYKFLGKGKRGEEQYKFFREALLDPYSNGTDLLDAARQSIKNDYKALLKEYPFVKGELEKLIPNSEFTYDQAIRVAIWDANGVEIPGLTKKDQRMLSNFVNNDPDLTAFKNGLLITGKQGKDWIKPEANWDSSTIISDLHGLTEGNGRKKFLEEFIANYEEIFGKWEQGRLVGPNMNKVEALYGTDTREAIEDVLYRMTTGKNRSHGKDKGTNAWSNWVNNSTGNIMFLNIRSASLQLLGAVNFLNLRDNNPVAAGKAFANQKQYWEDFATIWNSDKMKERRGGLKEDVAASEIANAAAGSKNKASAVISWLLKKGYAPTQLADSFAIASGGAPFYRNRINSYLKEGLTKEEAEDKAWTDFTKVSDETQQSGDPRDISQQQASPAGRLLLTFQNTAMQQSRIVKKSFLDLKNGRGNAKTHVSKIIYYLAIQNIMFSALQQGLFAVIFGDDEEEEKYKEKDKKSKPKTTEDRAIDVANGVLDSILRGTGYYGAIVATLKNMAVKYLDEKAKDYKADYAKVVLEGLNISPPIGSKARKVYSALQQTKFEKDLIEKRGWDVMQDGRVHLGPMYSVTGKLIEAGIGAPADRLVNKIENVSQAMNSQHDAWQRVALLLGWNSISLGIEEPAGDIKIREEAKAFRKEAGKIKAKETRQRTKDSIRALPLKERIAIKRAAALKRREDAKKRREEKKKRKMG
jgi:hypothetical protein